MWEFLYLIDMRVRNIGWSLYWVYLVSLLLNLKKVVLLLENRANDFILIILLYAIHVSLRDLKAFRLVKPQRFIR